MIPPGRHYQSLLTDSARWSQYRPRPGDVAVCTPPKSGTTWMQAIVTLLVSADPAVEVGVSRKSPWLDNMGRDLAELLDGLDAQTGRRLLKSHTPLDGLPWHPEVTYLAVYRHPLDVHFSMRKHVSNMPIRAFDSYYPPDESEGFRIYIEGTDNGPDYDAPSLSGLLRHYRTFRAAAAERENVHLFHYADLTRDLVGAFDRIGRILGISHPPQLMRTLTEAATFDAMKARASRFAPAGGEGFWKDDADFFDSGTSKKWLGRLTDADLARYDAVMKAALRSDERLWLEEGTLSAAEGA